MFRECRNDNTDRCTELANNDDVRGVLFEGEPRATFWLTLGNNTVEMRGGFGRSHGDVVLTWTAPRPLNWVRLLTVGVQHNADQANHIFHIYRGVGECFRLIRRVRSYFGAHELLIPMITSIRLYFAVLRKLQQNRDTCHLQ